MGRNVVDPPESTTRVIGRLGGGQLGGGQRDPFPSSGGGRGAPGWSPATPEQRTRAAWSSWPPPNWPPPNRPA